MTTPGGYSAGTIFLQVVPSFRNFQRSMQKAARDADRAFAEGMSSGDMAKAFDAALDKEAKKAQKKGDRLGADMARGLQRGLEGVLKNTAAAIRVSVDEGAVEAKLKALHKRAEALLSQVDLDIDIDGAREVQGAINEIERSMQRLRAQPDVEIEVQQQLDRALADLKAFNAEVDKAVAKTKRLGIDAENQKALQRKALGAMTVLAPIKLRADLDGDEARNEALALSLELEQMLKTTADVDLDADGIEKFEAELRGVAVRLAALDGKSADIEVNAIIAKALADLKLVERQATRLDRMRVTVQARVKGAEEAGASLRSFNAIVLLLATTGPALVPILGAISGALLAIGPAAAAAGAGLGVMILGFSGIGPAVEAMSKAAEDGEEQARALGKTQRAAAKAVVDAERSVERARQSGAKTADQSAKAVTAAQRRVAQAQKSAAREISQAVKGVERAEKDLARAQVESRKAQEALREARKLAKDDLLDLESKVKKGALDERQALIDLFEAQVAFNEAQADGGATNLEREQTAIALERARLAIADQRRENEQLRAEQARLAREGIEGTDRVVSARERAVDAAEREKEATTRVGEARERVTEAQTSGAERIQEANQAVADAQASAAEASLADSDRMQDALRGLQHAQENYRDTMLQTTATADALADAMADLSPAGQAFAEFIFSLRGEFDRLRAAAQEGMLPGVQRGIEALLPYMPQIEGFVSTYADLMGDMFEATGKGLTTQPWRDFFGMLEENGPEILKGWGGAFGNLGELLAVVMTTFAPFAEKFAAGLERMTRGWADWASSDKGQEQMTRFMGYLERTGPKVVDFLGEFFGAIGNALVGLAPYGDMFLGVLGGILGFLNDMPSEVLGAIIFGLTAIVVVIQVLAGLGTLLFTVANAIGVVMFVFGLGALGAIALIGAVLGVVVAFGVMYAKVEWFRNGVNAVFRAIGVALKWVWDYLLKPVFDAFGLVVTWLWSNIIKPVFGFIINYVKFMVGVWMAIFDLAVKAVQMLGGAIADFYNKHFKHYVDAMIIMLKTKLAPAFDFIADIARQIWQDISDTFSGGAEFVVRVINDYIIKPFNKVADFFGSKKIDLIGQGKPATNAMLTAPRSTSTRGGVQAYATGGHVGGFSPSPTADNIPAWLTAGEYVLPVNAVKKLRGAFGDQFLEWLRGGGGYATGGLVEFGRLLQGRGFRVAEHPAFGGVRGRHAPNSFHYRGQAIDVNSRPGTSPQEQRELSGILGLAREYGLRSIFMVPGHYGHAHFDTGKSGNMLGKVTGALGGAASWVGDKFSGAVEWAKDGPISWVKNQIMGGLDTFGDNPFGGMMLDLGKRMMNNVLGGIARLAGLAGDFVDDDPENNPSLYDRGGWLPPGISQVANLTGKPELILTPEQADAVLQGGGQYQINVPMMPTDSTPAEVADAVLFAARQISRGGVYAGVK